MGGVVAARQGRLGPRRSRVRDGAFGAARLLGLVPVPARVTAKRRNRSWEWTVGPGLVRMAHRVEPLAEGGCRIAIDLSGPPLLESLMAATYGPLIERALVRLARAAEERSV